LKRLLVFGFACLAVVCSCTTTLQAQSLTLTPAILEAQVRRGATYANSFTLMNGTNARLRVRCSLYDYWYSEKNQRLTARPGTLPRSASAWVQFSSSEVLIEPKSSASVKFVISVPQDAAGGYYTSPTFEAEAADELPAGSGAMTSQAKIKIRFHGLLLLTTTEATEYNVEIMDVQLTPPTRATALELRVDVRNRSTAHTRLQGVFAVLDESRKLAARGRIQEKRLLPGERNILKAEWPGELIPGRYIAIVTLTYNRVGDAPASIVYELPFEAPAAPR
jgi:hypothetical protein